MGAGLISLDVPTERTSARSSILMFGGGSAWLRTDLKYLGSKWCCSEPYGCIYNQHGKGEAFRNAFCSAKMLQPFKWTCCIAVTHPSCSMSTQQLCRKQELLMTPPHMLKVLSRYLEYPAVSCTVLPPVYHGSHLISYYGVNALMELMQWSLISLKHSSWLQFWLIAWNTAQPCLT